MIEFFSLPNIVTGLRIIAAPFLFILVQKNLWLESLILCFFCGFTDFLDGYLARLWNQSSLFGKLFDPIADKIFITFIYIALFFQKRLPASLVYIVFLRDILLVVGSIFVLNMQKNIPLTPLLLSKMNTFLQIFLCFWILFKESFLNKNFSCHYIDLFTSCLIYGTMIMTILSGLHYAKRFMEFYK